MLKITNRISKVRKMPIQVSLTTTRSWKQILRILRSTTSTNSIEVRSPVVTTSKYWLVTRFLKLNVLIKICLFVFKSLIESLIRFERGWVNPRRKKLSCLKSLMSSRRSLQSYKWSLILLEVKSKRWKISSEEKRKKYKN